MANKYKQRENMRYIWAIFVLAVLGYFAYLTAFYAINQHEKATVYTIGCFEKGKGPCITYTGRITRNFFTQDYIISQGTQSVELKKDMVASMRF